VVAAHALLAWLATAALVLVLAVALATASGRLASYRALDRALIVQLAASAVASLVGIATFVAARPVSDPLHLLYGVILTGLPTGARVAAQGRTARSVGRWVAIGALVAVGATLRSFMTGR
jgi:hypothetical protein